MRLAPRVSLLALSATIVGFTACAPADEPVGSGGARFGVGRADELEIAIDLGTAALDGADSPIAAKQIVDYTVLSAKVDVADTAHVKVQQLSSGVPVFGGEAIVHLDTDGAVTGYTDALLADVRVDTRPDYTADEAIDLAIQAYWGGDALSKEPIADLFVLRHDDGDHLVWRVQLAHLFGDRDDAMPVFFVDAHDGALVWAFDNLQTATCSGTSNFYGTVSFDCYESAGTYYLENVADQLGTYTYNNTTTTLYYVSSTSTAFASDEVTTNAVEAQYVAKQVIDYYAASHSRDGIDGAGGPAYITSHGTNFLTSATSYSTNYVNAFWDSTDLFMTYGDGDGVNSNSLTTLDIGGHEFTHGVTQYEANLTYSGEPGHLNESYSDVFGAMVERSVAGESSATWLVGEDTWTPGTSGDALRYMDDPADDGVSYDYYSSTLSSVDVHYGSGVPNLAFYLMSEGGTHPRGKSSTSVTAMGADDAAKIWYLALTSYMTSTTKFSGARTAQLSAAASLFGSTSAQYATVQDAWAAVGVGSSSTATCTATAYSGSLTKAGRSAYEPGTSGASVSVSSQTVSLSGPATANFDLYLESKSGSLWSVVATSATSGTSTESISYTGASGTYRVRVRSVTGKGTYNVSWCK